MRSALSVIFLLGLLAATAGVAFWVWPEMGAVGIGWHGRIALGLGALFTFLLGAGLMALMFLSSRRGYDERAHQADPTHADHWPSPPDQD